MAVGATNYPGTVDTATELIRVENNVSSTIGAGGVTNVATTVPVTDTTGWPADGVAYCGTEAISYTGKTGTSLTGCVRGFDGTTAASHAAGDAIYADIITSAHHEALRGAIIAIETLLGPNAADLITTLNSLYVWRADYNAKGNVLVGTSAGNYTPVAVGTNGQSLVADSAQTSGTRWGGLKEILATTRSLPTAVGNYINIGTFQTSLGAHNLRVAITVSESSFSVSKVYDITTQYDETANAWLVVRPTWESGPWSTAADFELLANQSTETITLRIRRTLGTVVGTATVQVFSLGVAETVTASTTTGTDATVYGTLQVAGAIVTPYWEPGSAAAGSWPKFRASGTVLTTPEVGAIEYDAAHWYTTLNTTSGRGDSVIEHPHVLAADGSALGPTIADFFGATSSISLPASSRWELEAHLYYTKTTAGTVTYTITNSAANYTNIAAKYQQSAAAGMGTAATSSLSAGIKGTTTAAAVLPATTSLTTAVDHFAIITATIEMNAAGNIRIRVTSSAGTVTPLRGSFYKIRRLDSVGTKVA